MYDDSAENVTKQLTRLSWSQAENSSVTAILRVAPSEQTAATS